MPSIVITGPESCGKTTLAKQLATHFEVDWLPEFARGYLENLGREYEKDDLVYIAKGQLEAEKKFAKLGDEPQILDTSLEVIKIWSEVKYGDCHPFVSKNLRQQKHDLYLLCGPDLPWEPDPLRESPNDRNKLFTLYDEELTRLNVNFVKIEGQSNQRFDNALKSVLHFQKLKFSNR